ncbi:MAG: hypothetical protein JO051_17330 [Acidobacteriaceae bacterium]|nr:hypothetical protein [Acidobacteriaceae bacterium]
MFEPELCEGIGRVFEGCFVFDGGRLFAVALLDAFQLSEMRTGGFCAWLVVCVGVGCAFDAPELPGRVEGVDAGWFMFGRPLLWWDDMLG